MATSVEIRSPDGRVVASLKDDAGARLSVTIDQRALLSDSSLGLAFQDGTRFGPNARIVGQKSQTIDTTSPCLQSRSSVLRDHCYETRIELSENGRIFGLILRAYDDGIAFRYDLPVTSGLGQFVLTEELTEFHFAEDAPCWAGEPSDCAEVRYPGYDKLSALPITRRIRNDANAPYLSVLPLLVRSSQSIAAVAESGVRDWPAMFLQSAGGSKIRVRPARRMDGNGLVVSAVPRQSPWRVLMLARTPAELLNNQLVTTLAAPSKLDDEAWIRPGVAAWDPWWTGLNPNHPPSAKTTGVEARGDTVSDKNYIDLAADMLWQYQVIDWHWYANMTSYNKGLHSNPNASLADFTRHTADTDVPELIRYAKSKHIGTILWAHSLDLKTFGEDKALAYFASLGAAGVKIDFISSQSQETVQWCERVLELAAKYRLLVDFHGTYHPTGLSRTYPNLLTQEGVLGNEYNKLPGKKNDPTHQLMLPFTRALLGPMDYTPGAFLNRYSGAFAVTSPAEGMGTRCRELALTVIYPSPLLVLCDAPANYRDQPGNEFLRALPTTWDQTVVLSADIGQHVYTARRSGKRWYLAAVDQSPGRKRLPLKFLDSGQFKATLYADSDGSPDATAVAQSVQTVTQDTTLEPAFNAEGGFVAVIEPVNP